MTDTTALDPKKFHRTKAVRSSDILFAMDRRADNQSMLIGSSDAGLYEVNLSEEKPERTKFSGEGHRSYITGVVALADQAVTCSYDGRLIWWSLPERRFERAAAAHDKWIRRLAATPDGKWLISIADDMRCRVWDAATAERVADFTDHSAVTPHHFPSMLYALAVSRDGRFIATGDRVGHIVVWSTESWTKQAELETPLMYTWDPKARRHSIGGIRSLAFSPDGTKLAVGGIGKINNIDHLEGRARVEIFDWHTGKRLHELEEEKRKGLVEQIVWLTDTPYLLAAGGDNKGFLIFYNAETGELVHQDGTDGHIHAVSWSAAAQQLYLAAHESLELWSIGT